jgi:hypothetical protein
VLQNCREREREERVSVISDLGGIPLQLLFIFLLFIFLFIFILNKGQEEVTKAAKS